MMEGAIIFTLVCFIGGAIKGYKQTINNPMHNYPTSQIEFGAIGNPNHDYDKPKQENYEEYEKNNL